MAVMAVGAVMYSCVATITTGPCCTCVTSVTFLLPMVETVARAVAQELMVKTVI